MGDAADDNSSGSTNRYEALPSLQSLQQMKTRLHTAFLGKRLMKWKAAATSKELKKISDKLATYQQTTFTQEFTQALMLLARCRFHNPEFHKVMLNNVGNTAQLTVTSSPKYIAGTKIWILEMIQEGPLAHPYTCIGRGGEVLKQARDEWHKLLKHLLVVLQLRENFNVVYTVNKEATKKQKVMEKIVIPKTVNTIKYITNELEELNREDFFRLKKIKEVQNRKKKKAKKYILEDVALKPCAHVCPVPNLDDIDAVVCHSCNTTGIVPPTGDAPCPIRKNESSHTHSGTAIAECLDNSFDALAKVMNEDTLPDYVKEKLSNIVHNFTILKHKLAQSECESKCKKKMSSFHCPPLKPSKYNFETLPVKFIKSTVSKTITPKQSVVVKLEAELDEGTFEVEYNELTKIKRTKGPDGKIKEVTKVVKTTSRNLSKHLGINTSSYGERSTPSQAEPEVKTTKSQIGSKTSNISTDLRSCVSWCVHATFKTCDGESDKEKITTVQRKNAQKGVILLPGEMSNKVAREIGTSNKDSKKESNDKKCDNDKPTEQ